MAGDVVNPGFYADFGALTTLGKQVKQNDPQAIRQAARQFESLFTEMMLKSMRAAKLGDGLGESQESDFYQDMYDQQLAVQMSQGKGLGLADMLVQQLTRRGLTASAAGAQGANNASNASGNASISGTANPSGVRSAAAVPVRGSAAASGNAMGTGTLRSRARPVRAAPADGRASSSVQQRIGFVQKMLPYAQRAASALGVSADTLIAQAALETGWGRHLVGGGAGDTAGSAGSAGSATDQSSGSAASPGASNNLFGIKAGSTWEGSSVSAGTTEYSAGSGRRVTQSFRAYGSIQQGFNDYVSLIKGRSAYQGAVGTGANATAFASALQRGGYATDPDYVDKLVATTRTVKSLLSLSAASNAGPVDSMALKLLAGVPIQSGEEPA